MAPRPQGACSASFPLTTGTIAWSGLFVLTNKLANDVNVSSHPSKS